MHPSEERKIRARKGERKSTLKQTFCENVIISKLFLSCNSPWIYSPVLTALGPIPRWKYYTTLMYEKSCESSIKSSRHKEGSRINCAIKLVITLRETSRWGTFSFCFFFSKKRVRATVELIKILLTSLKRPPEQDERNKSLLALFHSLEQIICQDVTIVSEGDEK